MSNRNSHIPETRKTGSQPGETFKFFKNTYRMYMIAEATDEKLIKNYVNRQNKFGITNTTTNTTAKPIPHITMMHIHINGNNPDYTYLIDGAGHVNNIFKKLMEQKYHQISPEIYLKSSNTYYDIMGDFFAKIYTHDGDKKQITDFRIVLYMYLEMYLGKFTNREKIDVNGRVFFVYSYRGNELIAVPEYYHGIGVWTPHLSIIKIPTLKRYNPDLLEKFAKDNDPQILIDIMKGVKGSISYLNLGIQFNKLTLSVKKL